MPFSPSLSRSLHCALPALLCSLLTVTGTVCPVGAAADEPIAKPAEPTAQTGSSGRATLDAVPPTTPAKPTKKPLPGHSLLRSRSTRSAPAKPVADAARSDRSAEQSDDENLAAPVPNPATTRRPRAASESDPFLETQQSETAPQPAPRIIPRRATPDSGRSLTERLRTANRETEGTADRSTSTSTNPEPDLSQSQPPVTTDDAEAAAEPGNDNSMLSRLRGLYSPRIDENTERLRRQMLRLSDPFGLIHEREEAPTEPAAVEADTPLPEPAGDVSPGIETTPPADSSAALTAAILLLEDELKNWPRNSAGRPENLPAWRRRQTDLRLLLMVAGRGAESVRTVEALPREEQEFWQSLMMAMNQYRMTDESIPRSDLLGETLRQLRTAERRLQPLARLEISRLQLCSRINGFGNVVAFPTSDFEPGQRLLLYVGLRNFRSELTSEGRYRTESAAVIEYIREEDGQALEPVRLPSIPDECDEQRTDFYQSIELTAPLLEGSWIVRVRVRDQLSMQTTEAQLKLNVR